MSEIAEIRKLFQDLIAPGLKSIATDLAAFKINVDHQFKTLKESMEQQFAGAEALSQARYIAILAKIEMIEATSAARHDAVLKALDIDKRLERVEARQPSHRRSPKLSRIDDSPTMRK